MPGGERLGSLLFLVRTLLVPVLAVALTLAMVPMMVIGGGVIFGIVVTTASTPMVAAILTFLASLILGVVATAQLARYAGSFSGALPRSGQIPFMRSFKRTFWVSVAMIIVTVVLSFTASLLMARYGLLPNHLRNAGPGAVDAYYEALVAAYPVSLTMLMLLLTMFQAIIIVPFACGMGARFALAWTGSFFLLRLFVMLPLVTALLFVLSDLGSVAVLALLPTDENGVGLPPPMVRQALMTLLVMPFAFAAEGAILAHARWREDRSGSNEDRVDWEEEEGPASDGSKISDLLHARMSEGR